MRLWVWEREDHAVETEGGAAWAADAVEVGGGGDAEGGCVGV